MNYKQKISEYRKKFKEEETLKFVEFLELLIEWTDLLYEKRRLRKEKEKELMSRFPKKIFEELDKVGKDIKKEKYEELKDLLLSETSSFLISVTKTGNVKMVDFDSVQFNLYGIFGKEKIASMVEHVRVSLEEIIHKQKTARIEKEEKRKEAGKAWLKKVNEIPNKELIKLITKSMFKFTPSARTNEERILAIKNNQETILAQKIKFHNFEQKIVEATEDAKADAETSVNRQVGIVRRRVGKVSDEFKEKAKEFVSDEGPKRMIKEARDMILIKRQLLDEDVEIERKKFEGKGEAWKKDFIIKVEGARDRIGDRKNILKNLGKERRDFISNRAKSELDKAGMRIRKESADFEYDVEFAKQKFSGKAEEVLDRGTSELEKARKMILKEKSDFEGDVEKAKVVFDDKVKEIDTARADFKGKSELAADMFIQRGSDIESEMSDTISIGKKRFEDDRTKAQEKFKQRAAEITEKAGKHITGKKDIFAKGRDSARRRFLQKTTSITDSEGGTEDNTKIHNKASLSTGAETAKGKIEKANLTMIEKAKMNRKKMEQEMIKRRELFQYDVRFAQQKIKDNAIRFSEKAAEKREEFETVQEKLVARHKSKQKAHLIQNLLRTIRSMH